MITTIDIPGLELLHRGKVRDSFRVDATRRLIVVTDRISAFDLKIKTPIPRKGEVLNRLAAFWFDETKAIVENHLHAVVDPQAMVVTEALPIRVEMVVRGAISGSMWRGYEKGVRTFSGVTVGEGLTENALLPEPIVTPTTKEESDREITPKEIVDAGLVSRATYVQMEQTALALYRKGREVAARRGLILADTKYEFGLVGDALILIDEIHTPDSSRFWDREAYDADPVNVPSFDKEFVRQWMRANQVSGALPTVLPDEVVAETARRYATLFERLTGQSLGLAGEEAEPRLLRNLVTARILRDSKAPVSSRRGAS